MKTRRITVTARADGQEEEAYLTVCPDCAGEAWHIYRMGAQRHLHMQCTRCGVTFCDGSCAAASRDGPGRDPFPAA